ncbi:hypothetical protein BC936DRAFT_142062 [Jimgerdemannia flammicorona]|uniref:Cyclin N-terminal domain-containing protein n=1 Tax=Jimgerdemannia flammicorona TaxID=994334 RepID=A0A433A105_9FUNG|nr:hypothetical protein BC936DRAFT_142062 [Jimgerdemannia flammicorona]
MATQTIPPKPWHPIPDSLIGKLAGLFEHLTAEIASNPGLTAIAQAAPMGGLAQIKHPLLTPSHDGPVDFTYTSFDAILNPLPSNAGLNGLPAPTLPELLPFIKTITDTCKISVVTILVALIYVKRLQSSLPADYITEYGTAHRIFVSSVLVASKFLEDDPLTTKKLVDATSGEVWTMKDITQMEIAFLKFVKWDLRVEVEHLQEFLTEHDVEVPELKLSLCPTLVSSVTSDSALATNQQC